MEDEARNRRHSGKTVLVVDDDRPMRIVIKEILVRHGFNVILAETGEEALKKARAEKPDLITMDERLPGTNGVKVTSQLKQSDDLRHIPVIALTSHLSRKIEKNPQAYGFCCHLGKPFDVEELANAVRDNLRA